MWKGIDVDENIKDSWLEELNSLPVEIKSTDEGKDKKRVAFVIFRLPVEKENIYKKVEQNLAEKGLKVSSDIGIENRPRICIAENIIVGEPGWEEWWNTLAEKIKVSYEEAIKN